MLDKVSIPKLVAYRRGHGLGEITRAQHQTTARMQDAVRVPSLGGRRVPRSAGGNPRPASSTSVETVPRTKRTRLGKSPPSDAATARSSLHEGALPAPRASAPASRLHPN